jgi:antitoxin ChpS
MVAVDIRKQGGAAVITIPSAILKTLHLGVGERLELEIHDRGLMVRPISGMRKKRYSLDELLQGATPENMKTLNSETEWAREGEAVGLELA